VRVGVEVAAHLCGRDLGLRGRHVEGGEHRPGVAELAPRVGGHPAQPLLGADHPEERVAEVAEHRLDRWDGRGPVVVGRTVGRGQVEQGAHVDQCGPCFQA
jgi:hypothetical protein